MANSPKNENEKMDACNIKLILYKKIVFLIIKSSIYIKIKV